MGSGPASDDDDDDDDALAATHVAGGEEQEFEEAKRKAVEGGPQKPRQLILPGYVCFLPAVSPALISRFLSSPLSLPSSALRVSGSVKAVSRRSARRAVRL
jgi:hypothetical protein